MVVFREEMSRQKINTIIFDLGGVLIDWKPQYLYRKIFKTEEEVEWFLQNICTSDWNERQDEGFPIASATEELAKHYPEWEKEIKAYYGRWEEMLGGPIEESVEIFKKLKQNSDLKFYALTNWSAELFPIALQRFDFLHWFDGRIVSGEEKTRKPFPEFYQKLIDRFHIDISTAIFIDDNLRNIDSAQEFGLKSIHFKNPTLLSEELKKINLL